MCNEQKEVEKSRQAAAEAWAAIVVAAIDERQRKRRHKSNKIINSKTIKQHVK